VNVKGLANFKDQSASQIQLFSRKI